MNIYTCVYAYLIHIYIICNRIHYSRYMHVAWKTTQKTQLFVGVSSHGMEDKTTDPHCLWMKAE